MDGVSRLFSSERSSPSFGNRTPSYRNSTGKEKLILLALIDELTQLRDERKRGEQEKGPGMDLDPSADERQSTEIEGVKQFQAFDEQIYDLNLKLQAVADAARHLGSSTGLLSAVYHLRTRLDQIRHLFRATRIFEDVPHEPNLGTEPYSDKNRGTGRRNSRTRSSAPCMPRIADIELLPTEMEDLAKDLYQFLKWLNDVPEFLDEEANASILAFQNELKYWAHCLREHRGQLGSVAVAHYINDFTEDLGEHMDRMRHSLDTFIRIGVPIIQSSQKRTTANWQNLSTVATFLSGVTATTLQVFLHILARLVAHTRNSFQSHASTLSNLVNVLWFSSLVFSIASAINSQLAYYWYGARYRSPESRVPWLFTIWVTHTPLFFLVVSMIAFLTGLTLFTYSSEQAKIVSVVITTCTVVTSFALVCVALWFALERWTYASTNGRIWLLDVLEEYSSQMVAPTKRTVSLGCQYAKKLGGKIKYLMTHSGRFGGETGRLIAMMVSLARTFGIPASTMGNRRNESQDRMGSMDLSFFVRAMWRRTSDNASDIEQQPRPKRLESAVQRVMAMNDALANNPASPTRAQAESDMVGGYRRDHGLDGDPGSHAEITRIRDLQLGIADLQITQTLTEHEVLVKHMEFSPSGEYLATCSWDRTAIIWKIDESRMQMERKLYHGVLTGGVVNQVAWSPDGTKLLTRTQKGLKIWDVNTGVGQRVISRQRQIQSAAWTPKGDAVLSVEYKIEKRPENGEMSEVPETFLVRLDLKGATQETYVLSRIEVWDMAVLPDETRVVGVGNMRRSADNLRSSKRAEKRLFVYNMKTREFEHQVPLLKEVWNISLSTQPSGSTYALVSYKNKAPPQMWRIEMKPLRKLTDVRPCTPAGPAPSASVGTVPNVGVPKLILVHSFHTKNPMDFAGQSFFGGPDDSFVCCSSKSGEIYVWDRSSATFLHALKPEDSEATRSFACNRKATPEFVMVTGARNGALRIWSPEKPSPTGTPNASTTLSPERLILELSSTLPQGPSTGTSLA